MALSKEDIKGEVGNKTISGLSAYDILRMSECPLTLPTARSMTQARMDYEHREDGIISWYIQWYNSQKQTP